MVQKCQKHSFKSIWKKGIYMVQGYGSTEGWVVTSWHPMMGKEKMSSVGKTLKNVEVKIVHPETGHELTTNGGWRDSCEKVHICLKGIGIMKRRQRR
ncbi:AMP-binding protein [Bacillus cereus]